MTEKKLRLTTLLSLFGFVIWVLVLNSMIGWIDGTLLSYRIIEVICGTVVALSIVWWFQARETRAVFRMIVLLAAGLGFDAHVQATSRSLWVLCEHEAFNAFRTTSLWEFRQIGEIVALIYMLSVIVSRMFGEAEDNHYYGIKS